VSHACRHCASARVKCEEIKPCKRCRNRNLTCEFGSSEAGSAAAMHLLHLSATAHSHSQMHAQSMSPTQPSQEDASSRTTPAHAPPLVDSPTTSYHQPRPPTSSSLQQQQFLENSPSLTHDSSIKPEEGQLPTPDTVMDQGRFPVIRQVRTSSNTFVLVQFILFPCCCLLSLFAAGTWLCSRSCSWTWFYSLFDIRQPLTTCIYPLHSCQLASSNATWFSESLKY
jgi:hypothetical protein